MGTDVVRVEAINLDEIREAFADAPDLVARYVKSEMARATARVRRRFISQRLSGPPGIRGGEWKRQHRRHVKQWTAGQDLNSLQSGIRLSRFLTLHETGGTITAQHKGRDMLRLPIGERWKLPTRGGFDGNRIKGLFVLRRPGKPPLLAQKLEDGQIIPRFVLKGRVVIKAKLGFAQTVRREWPAEFPKMWEAAHRAVRVSMEQRMWAASAFVSRLVA